MSKNALEKAAGGAIAFIVPLCIGFADGWPIWGTALAVIGALVLTLLTLHTWQYRRDQAELRAAAEFRRRMAAEQAPPPPSPPPVHASPPSRSVSSVSLPSSLEGVPFTFGCTVHWRPTRPLDDSHADPAAVAIAAVLQRARQISHTHHPDDADTVVHALAASLGNSAATPEGSLFAWATDVNVHVRQEHREHLHELATLRRQQNLQAQRIAHQRMLRAYLGDEVLTSVGSTVVWWLARDEGQVRETVDLIGTLAQLSAAATNSEVDELFRHLVPEDLREPSNSPPPWFVPATTASSAPPIGIDRDSGPEPTTEQSDLLPDSEDSGNSLFGHQFADLAERHGHPDLAQQIRERYRTIDVVEPGREPAPPDGQGDFFEGELNPSASGVENGEVPPHPPEPEDSRDWGAGG